MDLLEPSCGSGLRFPVTAFFSFPLASQQLVWLGLTLSAWGLEVTFYQPCSNLREFQQQMNPNVLVLLLLGSLLAKKASLASLPRPCIIAIPTSSSLLSGFFFYSAQLLLGNVNESWQAGTFN